MSESTTIHSRLLEIIKKLNITQTEFAANLDVSQQYISTLIKGKRTPGTLFINNLCHVYNIDKTWLLTGTGNMIHLEDETALLVSNLLEDDSNPLYEIIKEIMRTYEQLNPSSKKALEEASKILLENLKKK